MPASGRGANDREIVMRTTLRVSAEALTALVNIASFAVLVGAVVAIRTQSLWTGLVAACTVFGSGALGFLYGVWRLYRPRSRHALTR
jgi:hypothetical protein